MHIVNDALHHLDRTRRARHHPVRRLKIEIRKLRMLKLRDEHRRDARKSQWRARLNACIVANGSKMAQAESSRRRN